MLTTGDSIRDYGETNPRPLSKVLDTSVERTSPRLDDYNYDCFSQSLSEGTARGIFGWLRSTGYPRNEEFIFQHPWLNVESSDDEEGSMMGNPIWKYSGVQKGHTLKAGLKVLNISEILKSIQKSNRKLLTTFIGSTH